MDLELDRVDFAVVGLTGAKCLKLLPPSPQKLTQKVVVGDRDGVLNVFAVKKTGETENPLKLPTGSPITRIELGGTADGPKDKIFISSETEVKGFTKKGKHFLTFDTNLTESVNAMCVVGNNLFVCGQHGLYHYLDLKDASSFISSEVINDLIVLTAGGKRTLMPVLACSDRVIRILEESSLLYSVPVQSCPTVLHEFPRSKDGEDQIVYGTTDGGVGQLQIGRELRNTWLIEPENGRGQVTCLDTYDLTGDGVKELVVGRDDGSIEVYKIGQDEDFPAKQIYAYGCNETVTCLVCGRVRSPDSSDILVSTYSGWIFGLTTETSPKNLNSESTNSKLTQEAKSKINKLRLEIEELEARISLERDKYQSAAESSEGVLSTIPDIAINDKFYLNRQDASYAVSIEVQTTIDNILIQSDVPVDLLDVEKNSAVVSYSDCNPGDGNFLLATYRCQVNTTRLDLKIRTIEGQYGTLQLYVTPNVQPKCCQVRAYKIKALSLHSRAHSLDPMRPYNRLVLRGGFSFAEIHSWIEFCLPEVPVKPPPDDTAVLTFSSTFLDTMLQCTYSKGEAEFKSDNISTISILKDVISKEASRNDKKKRNLDITWDINESSIRHTLDLLRPKLERQLDLMTKIEILESMAELDLSGDSVLTDEYADVLTREKEIVEEYKMQPAYLDRLYGMVTDLFIDKYKFQGVNVKNKIPALLEILDKDKDKYSYDKLLEFFNQ